LSNGNGHRWSKFWWQDWQSDPALRMCGLAAQGLWMRLLCVMHEAEPVGHLLVNGRQPTVKQVAALAAAPEKDVALLMRELEEAGVYSRTDDGVIYCRRMVRDAAVSDAGREHINKRWNSHNPNSQPNTPPNRVAKRKPNGEARSPPNTLEAEAESEAEERPSRSPPTADAAGGRTPAEPGTPQAGRRSNGSNPRAEGTNPRNLGTNPRASRGRGGFVSGGIAVLADRLVQLAAQRQDDDLTNETSYFAGLKILEGGRG
jgi:hypothetical protein